MTLTDIVIQKIIRRLIHGRDYRIEIVTLINASFLQYAIEFFEKVAKAKLNKDPISVDWYKKEFLNPELSPDDLIIFSGLNRKTITNMYNSSRREIVLEVTEAYYDELLEAINILAEQNTDIDLTLTIKFRGVSVDLTISESLIVINSLAVKRAQIRGGAWSTAGKQVETPLMQTLCTLFGVPQNHYAFKGLTEEGREVDFHLIGQTPSDRFFCEVKLMGKGNPESADAIIARDTSVFVADKLSDLNKQQLATRGVEWVELRSDRGYKRFATVLQRLDIPHQEFHGDVDRKLDMIFEQLFI